MSDSLPEGSGFTYEENNDMLKITATGVSRGDKVWPFIAISVLTAIVGNLWKAAVEWLYFVPVWVMIYAFIVHLRNRTIIQVTRQQITTRDDGPLPWPGFLGKTISVDDVEQIYVFEKIKTDSEGSKHITYELCIALSSGLRRQLLAGERDKLEEIEKRVKRFLAM